MSMQTGREDWYYTRKVLQGFKKITGTLKSWIDRLNRNREGKHSPVFIACCATLLAAILMVFMLFLPPYLGMSDDGSFAQVTNPVGIFHLEDKSENLYYNYYVREYLSASAPYGTSPVRNSQSLFILLAKWLDMLFSWDHIFDLRYLAFIYGILFLAAMALLIKQAVRRADLFSERIAIALAGVLVFADVSYVTYFSSFYAEPLMYICFLLCMGAAMALQEEQHNKLYLLVFTIAGMVLTFVRQQNAVIGLILGIMCIRFLFLRRSNLWRMGCICASIGLFLSSMASFSFLASDFTAASKYHSMTRGVLLQASDPVATLEEFGIDGSYSVLTDTNSNDEFPFVDPESEVLDKGFYDRYNAGEVFFYYMKHPKAMTAMLDISVKSALDLRRGFSGNYEKAAGMPKMAKSIFWSFWSSFKARSAPKTVGYLVLLLVASILLFAGRKSREGVTNRYKRSLALETALLILLIGLSQALITIVQSGDAEMTQHLFLFSVSIDLSTYFCFSELLHRLNAF